MSDERRAVQPARRRKPAATSADRLEAKVDEVIRRQDQMYLNGDAEALRDLAKFWRESGGKLQKLVDVAPTIIAAVQRDNDQAAFWRVTKRALNPLRPVGALAWTVIGTIGAAIIWDLFTAHH